MYKPPPAYWAVRWPALIVSPTGPRTADSWAAEEVLALAASLKTTNRAMVASVTEAARSVPTAADADAETPVLSAADIPWGEPGCIDT